VTHRAFLFLYSAAEGWDENFPGTGEESTDLSDSSLAKKMKKFAIQMNI
jgi:hypothetical protein